jgi:hypothetical protein
MAEFKAVIMSILIRREPATSAHHPDESIKP